MQLDKLVVGSKQLDTLKNIAEDLNQSPRLQAEDFNHEKTLLLHIDIVEGFLHFGALHSPVVAEILPYVVALNEKLNRAQKVFILDEHPEDAVEFDSFPAHCVEGSGESHLVKALQPYATPEQTFRKNSTNTFHAPGFMDWLKRQEFENIILVGDVTDICVLQAGLALKTWYNEQNKRVRMLLPAEGVDTFELPATNHDRTLMNLFSLYNLRQAGLEILGGLD